MGSVSRGRHRDRLSGASSAGPRGRGRGVRGGTLSDSQSFDARGGGVASADLPPSGGARERRNVSARGAFNRNSVGAMPHVRRNF